MRSIENKGCSSYRTVEEISSVTATNFEFAKRKQTNRLSSRRTTLGKPTPSKWDDAQKWLVNLSRGGEKNLSPRNSNADDLRLIALVPNKEDYSSGEEEDEGMENGVQCRMETKIIDCEESIWRINKGFEHSSSAVRLICVRDMGTDMTPVTSQEPSRTGTPIRARTPAAQSPISSGSSTPVRSQNGAQALELVSRDGVELNSGRVAENENSEHTTKLNPLETRAMAWDEAERAKYMARYKREEVKIQAWENHEKRKAEMEMKKIEVKVQRLKSRAQEKLAKKIAATKRIAEEKRANAEAKLNEKAVRTSERADYIRRTGHLPSSFSFKLPALCW